MSDAQSKVLTLVFTDLADSTALKTTRGDRVVHDLIEEHRAHVERLADECAGRVIDWAGDGCFLTFETSSAGVMFALRVQQVHAENPGLPGVRIGIHMGEVSETQAANGTPRVDGLAVDIAARISALAKPGQILMSSAVHASARQRLGVDALGKPILWQAHGTYELKGFDQPLDIGEAGLEGFAPFEAPRSVEKARLIRRAKRQRAVRASKRGVPAGTAKWLALAALIVAIGIVAYALGTRQTAPQQDGTLVPAGADDEGRITSLAVLPLENQSGDPTQAYFADGLTDTLTAEIAKIGSIRVISRTSTLKYRDTIKSIPEIAGELGVDALIEGSVFLSGNEVRIATQLIDGRTDSHIWADTYTGTLENVIALQGEVALAIAQQVDAAITPEVEARLRTADEVRPEAYQAYLRGLNAMAGWKPEGITEAIQHFETTISLDPDFAEAHAELALARFFDLALGGSSPVDTYPKVLVGANEALALDPSLGEAHAVRGLVNMYYTWDFDGAEREFLRGVELAPNSAPAHAFLGGFLGRMGRLDEGYNEVRIAQRLDPDWPQTPLAVGIAQWLRGDHDEAIQTLQAGAELHPDTWFIPSMLGLIHAERGDEAGLESALDQIAAVIGDDSPLFLAFKASCEAQIGRPADATSTMERIPTQIADHPAFAHARALVYAAQGDFDSVFDNLEIILDEKGTDALDLRFPFWKSLHDDPRYWELIERVGFPPLPPGHPDYPNEQAWLARKAAAQQANAPIEKIAVLPFANLMGDPEQEYFVDGMTETLVAQLVKIGGVRVISRTSAMRYKDSDEPIPVIASELGADALVEGSVLRAGNDVRITAQLVHGITDEHLWADSYDGTLDNILSLQSEVALDIAERIQVAVAPADVQRLRDQRDVAPAVQEAYLKARYHLSRRTPEDLDRAIDYFNEAIRLDDEFAPAYAGLANAYAIQAAWNFVSPLDKLPLAESAARRAIELDPSLAEAHAVMAIRYILNRDLREAEARIRRAIVLDPESPSVRQVNSLVLTFLGRNAEAIEQVMLARELDPVSLIINTNVGMTYAFARDYDGAVRQLEQTLEMDPNFLPALVLLPGNLALRGDYDRAIRVSETLLAEHGRTWQNLTQHAMVLAMAGRNTEARAVIAEAEAIQMEYRPAFFIAAAYAHLGEFDLAIRFAEQILNQKQIEGANLRIDPFFDPLRSDPRFKELIDGMNLPPLPPDHPVARMEAERPVRTPQ